MWRYIWIGFATVVIVGSVFLGFAAWWYLPERDLLLAMPELTLPAEAKQGQWGDSPEGRKWQEKSHKIGVALLQRRENGPIRCTLRVRHGAQSRGEPELEVTLENTSDEPVTLRVHRFPLDMVTFVLRDADSKVVSSFPYVTLHSNLNPAPPVVLKPHERDMSKVYLSVVGDHGFRSLEPGLYSLEAVFHENRFFDENSFFDDDILAVLGPEDGMLARSRRIPVRVVKS